MPNPKMLERFNLKNTKGMENASSMPFEIPVKG